tara:strand:+ start:6317 stop:6895 length:579 start_codon:yes stop_codon:yes gene_type:complete
MSIPLYGQNKDGNALSASTEIHSGGFKEISIITAADASHTLGTADAGTIIVSAALASGAVIKLPTASAARIGLKYRIIFTGTMAAAAKIQLPDAGSAVFVGVVTQERCGNAAGVAEHATAVRMTTVVTTQALAEKSMELDENNETFGGAIGTDLEFVYASTNSVIVSGKVYVNIATTALDGLQATMFTGTGY